MAEGSLLAHRLAVARTRGETIAAIHGLIAARLERNFRHAAALAACRLEHLAARAAAVSATTAAATTGGLPGGAAVVATAGLIGEAFARKELLLTRRERERACAIDASEGFIYVHERVSKLLYVVLCGKGSPVLRTRKTLKH